MNPVAFVGLGPLCPSLLCDAARAHFAPDDWLVFDNSLSVEQVTALLEPSLSHAMPHLCPCPSTREARKCMLQLALRGERVARIRQGHGFDSDQAHRDARLLRAHGLAFDVIPAISEAPAASVTWFDSHALAGRQILVPRMKEQAEDSAQALRAHGAIPLLLPTIELHPPSDPAPLALAIAGIGNYDLAVFTSRNGVDCFFDSLHRAGKDARALHNCQVAAIGPATGHALLARGIIADLVAREFRGESLADVIVEATASPQGKRVLLARAAEARDVLPTMLRQAGMLVDVVPAYETRLPARDSLEPIRVALSEGELDAILLTSSSSVSNLCELLGEDYAQLLSHTALASIGPITSQTIRSKGLRVSVEAESFTLPCLIEAIVRHFRA